MQLENLNKITYNAINNTMVHAQLTNPLRRTFSHCSKRRMV